jgi:hypothetical protein
MRSKSLKRKSLSPLSVGACVGTAMLAATPSLLAQAETAKPASVEYLAKENAELRKRLDSLEMMAQKQGFWAAGAENSKFVGAMSDISISGFVQASYFHDTSDPGDRVSNAYLWNTKANTFSINKVKVTLASAPVERSGDTWGAGFRTSLIWGQDSPVLNTGSPMAGFEALREAYVDLNVPIGTGLNVKVGQLISLLNYESGDGGAANANFSQGNQWFFTGNGPAAGVQVGYTFTDWLDVKLRVQNGLYGGPIDVNDQKTVVGAIGIKPNDKTWFSLIGWGGDGQPVSDDVTGGSVLAGHKVTDQLNLGFEFDYFNFETTGGATADLWSIGTWIGYDFTPTVGLALRAEYLDDSDGFGIKGVGYPGRPGSAIASPDASGDLASLTLTLNYKPVPNIKIQPEIRYDHTSYSGGFDGEDDRFIVGAGVSYLF